MLKFGHVVVLLLRNVEVGHVVVLLLRNVDSWYVAVSLRNVEGWSCSNLAV